MGQKILIGKPLGPNGMATFGNKLTAVLTQCTLAGRVPMASAGAVTGFQSSQLSMHSWTQFCFE